MLVGFPGPVQVVEQPPGISTASHFSDHPERSGEFMERSGAHVPPLRPGAESPGHKLRSWEQVVTSLPRCIQFRHSLIQVGADPPDQPGGRHEFVQHFPQRGRCPGLDAASGCQSDFRGKVPRAIPASAAAWLTWSNSSWVSENCTVFGRGTACRDRRRTTSSATMTTPDLESRPSAIGTAPGPSPPV